MLLAYTDIVRSKTYCPNVKHIADRFSITFIWHAQYSSNIIWGLTTIGCILNER